MTQHELACKLSDENPTRPLSEIFEEARIVIYFIEAIRKNIPLGKRVIQNKNNADPPRHCEVRSNLTEGDQGPGVRQTNYVLSNKPFIKILDFH